MAYRKLMSNQKVYFSVVFDRPVIQLSVFASDALRDSNPDLLFQDTFHMTMFPFALRKNSTRNQSEVAPYHSRIHQVLSFDGCSYLLHVFMRFGFDSTRDFGHPRTATVVEIDSNAESDLMGHFSSSYRHIPC
jgi:hypothetical protein